ncbi:hypothetical protein BDV38DRAFT_240008 [Aspergillus pseudotamarii]|uniref:Uncharacterized protein n=1 Tax=Aspergillus pseudotamarii TaxID=132259 RepID=A0A5N6T2T3_ASPPS|nr:uncharacterized protein BDV38DRAFT_240008 [Aspergillus pseudotamarii]KAE8140616.1 hypothetical protein BDV38DRAFT_240008 [Aspergillus pseudotamarii]
MCRVQTDSPVFVHLGALLRSPSGTTTLITRIIMHGQHVDQTLSDTAHTVKIFV